MGSVVTVVRIGRAGRGFLIGALALLAMTTASSACCLPAPKYLSDRESVRNERALKRLNLAPRWRNSTPWDGIVRFSRKHPAICDSLDRVVVCQTQTTFTQGASPVLRHVRSVAVYPDQSVCSAWQRFRVDPEPDWFDPMLLISYRRSGEQPVTRSIADRVVWEAALSSPATFEETCRRAFGLRR